MEKVIIIATCEVEIIERLTTVEERGKANSQKIDDHNKDIKEVRNIAVSIKEIALEIKYMRKDMIDVVDRLKELENTPKNRWNDLIKTIITVTVSALITFILIKLGIN